SMKNDRVSVALCPRWRLIRSQALGPPPAESDASASPRPRGEDSRESGPKNVRHRDDRRQYREVQITEIAGDADVEVDECIKQSGQVNRRNDDARRRANFSAIAPSRLHPPPQEQREGRERAAHEEH